MPPRGFESLPLRQSKSARNASLTIGLEIATTMMSVFYMIQEIFKHKLARRGGWGNLLLVGLLIEPSFARAHVNWFVAGEGPASAPGFNYFFFQPPPPGGFF